MSARRILLVECDGDGGAARQLKSVLSTAGPAGLKLTELAWPLQASPDTSSRLWEAVRHESPRVVLFCLPDSGQPESTRTFLELAGTADWRPTVVVVSSFTTPDEVVSLLQMGATDFLTLPLRPEEVAARVWGWTRGFEAPDPALAALRTKLGAIEIVGESPAFARLVREIPRLARCDAPILITGETGVGKEVIARAVQHLSRRSAKPFIPVNCGALPADLVENELFGHEAGAFTSALAARRGLVKEADGGTLFLDEIDCLPLLAQVKLLRFLQDGQFRPLGSAREERSNVRVLAASNTELAVALAEHRFRRDLYYRLNVVSVTVPPLRERADDIPRLASHFATKHARRFGRTAPTLSRAALQMLLCYDWPGNVRELENVVQRAVALAEQPVIGEADIVLGALPERIVEAAGFQVEKQRLVARFEREYLQRLLLVSHGNIARAAASAGKNRRAFWELMRKHGLCVARTSSVPAARPSSPAPPG